mgnify:CR=1 FL=1
MDDAVGSWEDRVIFRTWVKNTFLRSLPESEETEELEEELEKATRSREDIDMVYAIEESVKKELKKARILNFSLP